MKQLNIGFVVLCCAAVVGNSYALELSPKQPEKERKLQDVEQKYEREAERKTSRAIIPWAAIGIQGKRSNMEDAHIVTHLKLGNEVASAFCLFDGHGGNKASNLAQQMLTRYLLHSYNHCSKTSSFSRVLRQTFKQVDESIEAIRTVALQSFLYKLPVHLQGYLTSVAGWRDYPTAGSTALVSVLRGGNLFTANLGDSRAMLCGEKIQQLSTGHGLDNKDEVLRLIAAGYWKEGVDVDSVEPYIYTKNRVGDYQKGIDVSRSLGHRRYYPGYAVIYEPEITCTPLTKDSEFVIMGCDGIWKHVINEEAVACVRDFLSKNPGDFVGAAKALTSLASKNGSKDNLTVLILGVADYSKKYSQKTVSDNVLGEPAYSYVDLEQKKVAEEHFAQQSLCLEQQGKSIAAYGLFGAHNGASFIRFIEKSFPCYINESDTVGDDVLEISRRLRILFENMDETFDGLRILSHPITRDKLLDAMIEPYGGADALVSDISAATALIAMFKKGKLFVANAGDNRAVLCDDGEPYLLSDCHTLDNLEECDRLNKMAPRSKKTYLEKYKKGACLKAKSPSSLTIPVTRALGRRRNFGDYEEVVVCQPEVTVTDLTKKSKFLIIGSPDVWATISPKDATDTVNGFLEQSSRGISDEPTIALDVGGAAKALEDFVVKAAAGKAVQPKVLVVDVADQVKRYFGGAVAEFLQITKIDNCTLRYEFPG